MKSLKVSLLLASIMIAASSCSNKYEKAIADYSQTIENTKIDLGFKALDIKEIKTITAADSIAIYKEAYEIKTNNIKEFLSTLRRGYKHIQNLQAKQDSLILTFSNASELEWPRKGGDKIFKEYEKEINDAVQDSIENEKNFNATFTRLESMGQGSPLIVIVECRFSIKNPFLNNAVGETTAQFMMSPDGKICYGRYKKDSE